MRVLIWHVHGGWMDGFVLGDHDVLLPAVPEGGPWGEGRAGRDWPDRAIEVPVHRLRDAEPDLVVLQRPEELELVTLLTGRIPGEDLPAVYLEHNAPPPGGGRHPLADHPTIPIVHVTHFNRLMWDCGTARTLVIEHGIPDPGERYTGERVELGVVINEAVRRGRLTGTDLLPRFAERGPVRLYGIGCEDAAARLGLEAGGDLPPDDLHADLARSRLYLHPARWTSLGLSLLEAMHLGMPVVAIAATEVPRAVPPEAGAVSADVDELLEAASRLLEDPDEARRRGRVAREVALERYGLARFLAEWDEVLSSRRGAERLVVA